ncbi:tRNA (carboxymethyluridine(34)-5-O)-methyltransferase [Zancudomyces culisetae]|uniref:tRNA (Carboxymethyluridine(34)-5-O)-methyltransferase n=1 Tax=Zancudomyces culisetae TaxID=1213189 RepID=A0A1R1PUF1_ZANCU|nr:tRNA (carboxymethyluridine(34)-5-O)-methyltransferase [Zancudomyces culisetae]|eukprot:OMH84522.1 tRNA (carboxymethyluridine(34)-5-O)-methyltransferase [Zancudomyces culisetae]
MKTPLKDQLEISDSQKELEYVHNVYDQISNHFSNTRYKPWPVIARFIGSLEPGSLGADVGCGNGKYMGLRNVTSPANKAAAGDDTKATGDDTKTNTSATENEKDNASSTRDLFISGSDRIVKKGGKVLLYVWAHEQDGKRKFDQGNQDFLVPWTTGDSTQYRSWKAATIATTGMQSLHMLEEIVAELVGEETNTDRCPPNPSLRTTCLHASHVLLYCNPSSAIDATCIFRRSTSSGYVTVCATHPANAPHASLRIPLGDVSPGGIPGIGGSTGRPRLSFGSFSACSNSFPVCTLIRVRTISSGYVADTDAIPANAPAVNLLFVSNSDLPGSINSRLNCSYVANCTAEYGTILTTFVPFPRMYPFGPSSFQIFTNVFITPL